LNGLQWITCALRLGCKQIQVDDLVFALEASNTENKYLHDEIMRLKRKSRQSLNDITNADRDPKTFMKEQVE